MSFRDDPDAVWISLNRAASQFRNEARQSFRDACAATKTVSEAVADLELADLSPGVKVAFAMALLGSIRATVEADLVSHRPPQLLGFERTSRHLMHIFKSLFTIMTVPCFESPLLAEDAVSTLATLVSNCNAHPWVKGKEANRIRLLIWQQPDLRVNLHPHFHFRNIPAHYELKPQSLRIRHSTSVENAIRIMHLEMIEARSRNDQYVGFPFVWFGHEIIREELARLKKKGCKEASNTLAENRYGSVTFSMELTHILPHSRRFYSLGTREFRREHSHSILVTEDKGETSYSIINGSNIRTLEECADRENNSWPKEVPLHYSSSGEWSHPEWAFAFDISLTKALREKSIKIDFVDHAPETCVKNQDCWDCKQGRKTRAKSLKDFDDLVCRESIPLAAWLKADAFRKPDRSSLKWTTARH
jgi:hypothetical protein